MDMESRCGLMEQDMKVFGKLIRHTAKANFITSKVMSTTVNGTRIKYRTSFIFFRHMDTEFILILMEQGMRDNGRTICRMDMELKYGKIKANMRATTRKA
jgi:hypothetical protein